MAKHTIPDRLNVLTRDVNTIAAEMTKVLETSRHQNDRIRELETEIRYLRTQARAQQRRIADLEEHTKFQGVKL